MVDQLGETRSGGTHTFLFTDIESSTPRWQADQAGMASALAAHDATLTALVEANDGRVFKHTGDGMCAVFESARTAMSAAVAAQDALELPVRMGLHTGEADERDGDFFGPTLNRCARIMDAGHGGQILCSAATWELISGVGDIEGLDLGEHRLRGLDRDERIHQIGSAEFPTLRSSTRTTSLPVVLTSLVGRDGLIEDVIDRTRTSRLVTLVGVGGVGKTRVALAVAERLADEHDVTTFVNLTEVSDNDDVLPAVARTLGVKTPTLDAIGVALSSRSVLLVLDNCEHVLDAAAETAEALLGGAPTLRVLATSREGLAIDGEQIVAVPGLDASGADSTAVGLFVDRAMLVDPSFDLGDEGGTIEQICERLDGLPLAIELAAARVGVLTPPDLLDRLDERFKVLTGGRRRRSRDRQRTLRETVDWSHDLLEPDEQEAFAKLSVFAGSFGLDGAVVVLDGFDEVDVVDLLGALVDKSLLNTGNVDGFRRYRYLETIRSYAEDRLDDRGETAVVTELLHRHLVGLVADSIDEVLHRSEAGARRLRLEIPNLRRSFEEALCRQDVAAAVALVAPYAAPPGVTDWPIMGWADEALAGDAAIDGETELALLALQMADRWLSARFDELAGVADGLIARAEELDLRSRELFGAASGMYILVGDTESSLRCLDAARNLPGPADDDHELFGRLILYRNVFVPPRPHQRIVLDPIYDVEGDLATSVDHPSPVIRSCGEIACAARAYQRGEFEDMLRFGRDAERSSIFGSAFWFGSLQVQSWAEYLLGDLEA
ncbi:MAG: adenylate/guanylate cyclase domain-containing protein, partial [Acidimicrobiia bacterium]|nr:adenylate/guanylate cyclase domain-containing protein [Acidimicrobiia bacterium]